MRGVYGGGLEGEEKVSWQLIDVLYIYMSFGCEVLLCCVFFGWCILGRFCAFCGMIFCCLLYRTEVRTLD